LADGTTAAALAMPGSSLIVGERVAGGVALRGSARPVLSATEADLVLVPVALGGDAAVDRGRIWCLVAPGDGCTVTPIASLDETRPVGEVTCEGVVSEEALLAGLTDEVVTVVMATLAAAECAGGADWCVETASSYAKVREQFGRPIGQFQAVKHRCSDMLVRAEQARGTAWDAAAAVSAALGIGSPADSGAGLGRDGPIDPVAEAGVAVGVAASVAPDVFVECAKDCIQVLGGIGFTWEHDAHLYLKRATALRQLVGGTSGWRSGLAKIAIGGARRQLRVDLPAEAGPLRATVRAFAQSVKDLEPAEQRRRVVDAGYFVPHWPAPWGRDAGAVEQIVIDEEFRAARVRRPNLAVGAWAAPTIVAHGTVAQQERWVRPTLLGEINWCQMFSEPGAGSDLASLSTKAVKADGGWLLSGQKVWTSMAGQADWAICLARTNPTAAKHLGITYFILDMRTEGLDVRPLRELTGHAMFNEVFLSDVFIPDDCVIGEVDQGWPLARTTLANERVAMGSGSSFGGGVESLLGLLQPDAPAAPAAADPAVLVEVGGLLAEAQSVALLGLRTTLRALTGAKPGPESSVRKLLGVEHDQRVQEFGVLLLGAEGATAEGPAAQWTGSFLANRCLTIAGGTSEVQRNIIAERLLGLPRDPEPARP
jgi:alkylation response protein AidB-like acyl-CoA dehydrogenase